LVRNFGRQIAKRFAKDFNFSFKLDSRIHISTFVVIGGKMGPRRLQPTRAFFRLAPGALAFAHCPNFFRRLVSAIFDHLDQGEDFLKLHCVSPSFASDNYNIASIRALSIVNRTQLLFFLHPRG